MVSFKVISLRVAARHLSASLETEFERRFEALLAYAPDNPPPAEVGAFRKWLSDNFKLAGRVPNEAKKPKEELERFWRFLDMAASPHLLPGAFQTSFRGAWEEHIRQMIPQFVQLLSSEGTGKVINFEKRVGTNTYINLVGAGEDRFDAMVGTIEKVFAELKGWHRGALDGGVRVVFAGPKDFRGTASGRYRSDKDELWVRATSGGRLEKGGDRYGGLGYVITHELGHRYERKHPLGVDFDQGSWHTSTYSRKEGESFAELFALTNFGMTSDGRESWSPEINARFERTVR